MKTQNILVYQITPKTGQAALQAHLNIIVITIMMLIKILAEVTVYQPLVQIQVKGPPLREKIVMAITKVPHRYRPKPLIITRMKI